jgi:hypothetical protein
MPSIAHNTAWATINDRLNGTTKWPVPSLRQGFSDTFADDCPFCKSRFFNKLAPENRPIQRGFQATNRLRAVCYSSEE